MELKIEFISRKELSEVEKLLLELKKERFFFLRYKGVVKVNKELPKSVSEIASEMWKYDFLLDSDGEQKVDALLQRVKQLAGEDAAAQLQGVWIEALREKLDAENKAAASEWLQGRDIIDDIDSIGSYNPGFISALWNLTRNVDTIFLHGYQTGMEAGRKAVGE